MKEHLPALLIVVPLMAAPICLFIRNKSVVRIFAILVAWTCLYLAWSVLGVVMDPLQGPINYHLGGWSMPMGIEYRIDAANAFVLLIVAGIGAVVMPFGLGHAGLAGPEGKEHLFYAALLLCMTGLLGIAITGDLFNVFVFLEITSLSSYTLIALGDHRRARMAAYTYLIMGTIGGTFLLLGIGFVFAITGSLNMADIAQRLPEIVHTRTGIVAFGFIGVGTGIKLAVFPLYQWLPNAYSFAPSKVSAFLSATATKVSYYVLARTIFTIFGAAFVFNTIGLDTILMPLSVIAMFVGSIAAIYQTDVKRLLAYSSIAQIGYMTLGLSFVHIDGLTGGFVHLFNHAIMKCGLFLVVGCVVFRIGSTQIDDMKGLMRKMPLTMWAFVIGGLSLIGVPGTVGFVSKWYLVQGALKTGNYFVAALTLISSLLAVLYVWKIVEVAVFRKADGEDDGTMEKTEAPLSMLLPTWVLMIAAIYFGLSTDVTVGVAKAAAAALMGDAGLAILGGTP